MHTIRDTIVTAKLNLTTPIHPTASVVITWSCHSNITTTSIDSRARDDKMMPILSQLPLNAIIPPSGLKDLNWPVITTSSRWAEELFGISNSTSNLRFADCPEIVRDWHVSKPCSLTGHREFSHEGNPIRWPMSMWPSIGAIFGLCCHGYASC